MGSSRIYKAPVEIPDEFIEDIIFLGGPIQGAPEWQKYVSGKLVEMDSSIVVASPRRDNLLDKKFDYNEQVAWETKYLSRAMNARGLFFWLPKPVEVVEGRSYAQTTRFELGEWYSRRKELGFNFYIGIEEGFEGERYIRKKFESIGVKVYDNLDEMIDAVVS